jgi:hypothetical protein
MGSLAVENLQGEYAPYDEPERWEPELRSRGRTFHNMDQRILGNHLNRRFRIEVKEDSVVAGSRVRMKICGITPLAALAIVGGRLEDGPPESLGDIVVPFDDSLDVVTRIPEDAESGTYVFFAQQWVVDLDRQGMIVGLPAYPGGSLIYFSKMASVEVRSRIDEEGSAWTAVVAKEAARVRRFPGVAFRGPVQDRRAWVVGTALDVWEVIEAYKAMGIERLLREGDLPEPKVRLALGYYEAYADEIDGVLAENRRTEEEWHRLYPEVFAPPEQSR